MADFMDFVDDFSDDRAVGATIDSVNSAGVRRLGVDAEGVIGVDHGALRIQPLLDSGWGRSQISYGPYVRRNGLMFAALVLNGHNTSQIEPLPESLAKRLLRWLQGHGDRRFGLARRLGQFIIYRRKGYMVRRLRIWRHMASGGVDHLDENLAIGWFGSADQGDPAEGGNSFVMHAVKGDNGELWTRSAARFLPVVRGVQNVPICYVAILRERGAAYYAASVPDAHGFSAVPYLRPLAVDAFEDVAEVYAGIHQAALGQIGFRVDTRVYGAQVHESTEHGEWFGTAHVADRLTGNGPLDATSPAAGADWQTVSGSFERCASGVRSLADGLAVVQSEQASGLLHVLVGTGEANDWTVGLVWRYLDAEHFCRIELSSSECRLVVCDGGHPIVVASEPNDRWSDDGPNSVQLLADDWSVSASVNGVGLFGGPVAVANVDDANGVGIHAANAAGCKFSFFEAHPCHVDLGDQLCLPIPWNRSGKLVVATDDFGGPVDTDLAGQQTRCGGRIWRREYGHGRILTDGQGSAAVLASRDQPNPGNTAYTIDWDHKHFADVSADVTPPGTEYGEGHRGRGGLVFWQDPKNFIMVSMYLDDSYDGASIAIFSHLDGFEEIYDAVWSMVGRKIYYGRAHRLRVTFDGMNLMTYIDDEPVLYRKLSDIYIDRDPMFINRVGVVVNWEWGDDTGTRFNGFEARADGSAS